MNLHFLVSISSESESLHGVHFFCSFLGKKCSAEVTLFHISTLNKSNSSSIVSMWENTEDRENVQLSSTSQRVLDKAKRVIDKEIDSIGNLSTKTVKEKYGKVRDILNEAANGLYDATILGRRTTYALQWMFERPAEEIPLALIRDASLSSPMWICAEPEQGRKNVLVCLDGSTSALRIADHVGYILSFADHHKVTLFHVSSPLSGGGEAILDAGEEVLRKHKIAPERIIRKVATGLSVTNTILEEKNRGRYAAVAVGLTSHTGRGVSGNNRAVGQTTVALLSKISKAALWCCP